MNSEGIRKSWKRKSWTSTSSMTHHLHAGNTVSVWMNGHDHVSVITKLTLGHCRRGNWITLKMRKLMKTRNREHSSAPPLRSESCEGLDNLRCRDNGSFTGSQGSEESGSNSLNGDGFSSRKSSSEYDLSYPKRLSSNLDRPETSCQVRQGHNLQMSWNIATDRNVANLPVFFRKILNYCSPNPSNFCYRELKEETSHCE